VAIVSSLVSDLWTLAHPLQGQFSLWQLEGHGQNVKLTGYSFTQTHSRAPVSLLAMLVQRPTWPTSLTNTPFSYNLPLISPILPHWSSCCFLNTPGLLISQGLYTHCFLPHILQICSERVPTCQWDPPCLPYLKLQISQSLSRSLHLFIFSFAVILMCIYLPYWKANFMKMEFLCFCFFIFYSMYKSRACCVIWP
jgi:hypothetical protein